MQKIIITIGRDGSLIDNSPTYNALFALVNNRTVSLENWWNLTALRQRCLQEIMSSLDGDFSVEFVHTFTEDDLKKQAKEIIQNKAWMPDQRAERTIASTSVSHFANGNDPRIIPHEVFSRLNKDQKRDQGKGYLLSDYIFVCKPGCDPNKMLEDAVVQCLKDGIKLD